MDGSPSYEAKLIKYFDRNMHRLRAVLSIKKKVFRVVDLISLKFSGGIVKYCVIFFKNSSSNRQDRQHANVPRTLNLGDHKKSFP